jgi:MYXO-CTERM domain-containing protein
MSKNLMVDCAFGDALTRNGSRHSNLALNRSARDACSDSSRHGKWERAGRTTSLGSTLMWSIAGCLVATPAAAVTTLTVDISTTIGPATHVASGSLYGVTETLPANVNSLIAPLRPKMFTNPAADQQQPVGDAIVVAGRLAPTGATVTIRLADWLKGFYTFTTMADWLDKVGQTVSRRKSAGLTNIYGYEIWNEPGGTWASSNPVSFNEFWRQTYVQLRQQDPGIKIIGPSYAYYSQSYISSFLSFCKTNNCVPDIISWHELGGGDLTGNINAYRSLEKQLGVGPLPISINEYSGAAHIDVEGQPGASAPIIAKFERAQVDSACISYWDVAHAGRLGSLLATNTDPNGGWWFYKWYGDMTGNMVSTTPPTPTSATALDGFANLDTTAGNASVLFGGVSDGTIQVVVKGFKAAPVFGSTVHAVVEHTPFVNRTTVVNATDTLSIADLAVANDQISVTVTGANATDGYRLNLMPIGAGTGGAPGTGGAGTGGTKATGGAPATGGLSGSGGSKATGGTTATGGTLTTSGTGGSKATGGTSSIANTGGTNLIGTGGKANTGGTANATGGSNVVVATGGAGLGGASATGGRLNGTGGLIVPSGGATSAGGIAGIGGGPITGGFVGTAGESTSYAVDAGTAGGNSSDAGSCSCRVVGKRSNSAPLAALGVLGLLLLRTRRRGR